MNNPSDPIGNRNRDFPTCSAAPQLTAPLRTPNCMIVGVLYNVNIKQRVLSDLPCDENSYIMMVWVRVISVVQPHLPLAEAA
jgi:hypothetical protein